MAYSVWHNFGGHTKQSSRRTLSASLHVCCRSRCDGSRSGRPVRATVIEMVFVEPNHSPIWWRGADSAPPASWAYVFEDLTGDDTAEAWGLSAAIFIAQIRRRTGHGPTFSELFWHLLPDTAGLPAPFPQGLEFMERRRVISGFRGHVAIEWRRRQMISWDRDIARSLRVGREFRERSRRRQNARTSWQVHRAEGAVLSLARPTSPGGSRP